MNGAISKLDKTFVNDGDALMAAIDQEILKYGEEIRLNEQKEEEVPSTHAQNEKSEWRSRHPFGSFFIHLNGAVKLFEQQQEKQVQAASETTAAYRYNVLFKGNFRGGNEACGYWVDSLNAEIKKSSNAEIKNESSNFPDVDEVAPPVESLKNLPPLIFMEYIHPQALATILIPMTNCLSKIAFDSLWSLDSGETRMDIDYATKVFKSEVLVVMKCICGTKPLNVWKFNEVYERSRQVVKPDPKSQKGYPDQG